MTKHFKYHQILNIFKYQLIFNEKTDITNIFILSKAQHAIIYENTDTGPTFPLLTVYVIVLAFGKVACPRHEATDKRI